MTATIHKVAAGNGYLYYLRNVAANDSSSRGRSPLSDYYSAHGESPGLWHGTGLGALRLRAGEEVTEEQMKNLFGLGRHPNANLVEKEVYDEQIRLGATHQEATKKADKESRLGNPFRFYGGVSEFRKRCRDAFESYNSMRGADPQDPIPESEREWIRTTVATEMFTEQYGRLPLSDRELSGWVAVNTRLTTAVAGFDITFSPVKSVSALWALAPRNIADRIEAAHQAAIDDALEWLERHGIYTRLGRNGVRQVDVDGLVAARFTHRDSRAGDPDLHTHVLIANRVRGPDGRWRTLDGAAVYRVVVTVSEIYNTRLEHHLQDGVGVEFAERPGRDPAKRPIREIVGVPVELITHWSRRDAAITGRLAELAAAFQRAHGREPIAAEMYGLADRATLETRPAKHGSRSRAEQRRDWRTEALEQLGGRAALAEMLRVVFNPLRPVRRPLTPEQVTATAQRVLEVVSEQRSTWQAHHVRAEIERQLRGKIAGRDWAHTTETVLAEALSPARVIAADDPDIADQPVLGRVPAALQRRDGTGAHTVAGTRLYTSAAVLAAEKALIALANQPGGRRLPLDTVAEAVRSYNEANPDRQLNAGQVAVIEGFATSGVGVQTANAPAGSGKTTAMQVLTDAWSRDGGTVLGLAPTASAAAVLADSIGARVETVDKLLDVLSRHTPAPFDPGVDRLHPPPLPEWVLQIGTGTLVIVDEHVKVGNLKRLRLLRFLIGRGATVRCIGDDRQLPAIDAGGADADMAAAAPEHTLTLTHVVRFASRAESAASLRLRNGDAAALGWYLDNDRIHAGHTGATHDDAYTAWIADHHAGRDAIMLAGTHEVVAALNARARADRLARADADPGAECLLADGLRASVGDIIRTRRNNPRLRVGDRDWVRNGYAWTVTAVHTDGSITATHRHTSGAAGPSVWLPSEYVRESVRLGYATTIDSAQGITADTCHVALTGSESRQQLYVALTRGVHGNHAYVPTALDGAEGSFLSFAAVYPRTAVEHLLAILARDGAQKSAHTMLREATDPHHRIGRALDIFLDTVGVAAEENLGTAGLARIDAATERVHPHLTDAPAYPVLRQQLAVLSLSGNDPVDALVEAAAERELDTAHDIAAVLHWRLMPGTGAPGTGPLPWISPPPGPFTDPELADHVRARSRIVADLAHRVRADAAGWTTATAPAWARPLLAGAPKLVADLAVWRAALHIDDTDPRLTGPPRFARNERDYQQLLDEQVTGALGDPEAPARRWTPLAALIEPRLTSDPYWPAVAAHLDTARRAGIDIESFLTAAACAGPLPDEMPAAALWSRLDLDTTVSESSGSAGLRPDWDTALTEVLGEQVASSVRADAGWPRLTAAVDRGLGTGWAAHDLLSAAHDLLTAARTGTEPALTIPDLVTAHTWRIELLLRPTPTTDAPGPSTSRNSNTHTPPPPGQHVGTGTGPDDDHNPRDPGPPDPGPVKPPPDPADAGFDAPYPDDLNDLRTEETMGDDPHPSGDFSTPPQPDLTGPAHPPSTGPAPGELPEQLRRVTALFAAGDLAAAARALDDVPESHRRTMRKVEATLRARPFPIARARLKWAAQQNPELRAVIEACIPVTDPHLYRRDRNNDGWQPPRDDRRWVDPDRIVAPNQQRTGTSSADRYFDNRPDLTDPWAGDTIPRTREHDKGDRTDRPDAVSARWSGDRRIDREPGAGRRREPDGPLIPPPLQDPKPYGSGGDHERTLLDTPRNLPCVECSVERALADHMPRPDPTTRNESHDDGLCGDCRETGITGIPPHPPDKHITARATHITSTRPPSEALALLRRDWTRLPLRARFTLSDWVERHGLADTTGPADTHNAHETSPAPSQPGSDTELSAPEGAADNPLVTLTDEDLIERITALQQRIALTDTDTDLFNPPAPPGSHTDIAAAERRHHSAQDAIRTARTADHDLTTATRALHAARSALHTARTDLHNTPTHKRADRRALRTRINTLTTTERNATDTRDTARTTARNATRRALHLAGPPEHWDTILARPAAPQQDRATADPTESSDIAREIRDRTHDIEHQLTDLRTEQQRRAALTPDQYTAEQRLRRHQPIDPEATDDHEPETSPGLSPEGDLSL
ncbi:MobF family relaxase [Nocardia sputi]|uniref:MobF family relaxase n=1 Tax=Nocardia sputi TaxID=2943705 RepID=UPI0020BE6DC2|nr:MobF family relaxase [Nocardia sputi]